MANSASDIKSAAQSEKIGSPYLAAVRCRFSLIAIYSKFGKQRTLENDAKLKLPRVKVKDEAKKVQKLAVLEAKGNFCSYSDYDRLHFSTFLPVNYHLRFVAKQQLAQKNKTKKTNFCHFVVCILPLCITLAVYIKKRVVPSVTILNSYRSPICSLLEYRAHRHNCM